MDNSKKIILDLCGGTGSWSDPYRDSGYAVLLITLPDYDITNLEFRESEIIFYHSSNKALTLTVALDSVYGIVAAPPCTQFSRARSRQEKSKRDFREAMQIVQACMEIIWYCRSSNRNGKHHGGLQFWALENPMGLLRQFLGNPPHSFRGWEWGDDHVKFTDVWGYYNMPTPHYKNQPLIFNEQRWANIKKPAKYAHLKLSRADVRAITPPHFAKAFMEANR